MQALGQLDQIRALVQAVGGKGEAALFAPGHQARQQMPIRASDVEEIPVPFDGLQNDPPLRPPPLRPSAKARLLARVLSL